MQPINILQIIDTAGPGGAETVFLQLVSRLDPQSFRSTPFIPRVDWLSRKLLETGNTPIIFESRGSFEWRLAREILQTIRSSNIDVIHSHLLGSTTYAAIASAISGVPVVATFHGPSDFSKAGRANFLKRFLISRYVGTIVAVSSGTKDAIEAFGLTPKRIELIPNGVDLHSFYVGKNGDLRRQIGAPESAFLIGAVGNIRRPKGYDILLRAAAVVLKELPTAHFVVVGQGADSELEELMALRSSLGIASQFHFLGHRQATVELYQNFDLFVSSSISEGLPLSFLEAMATGLPIVATRSGGAQEVLADGKYGELAPIRDPTALGRAIIGLLSNRQLREHYAQQARQRVLDQYNLQNIVRMYEAAYRRALNGAGTHGSNQVRIKYPDIHQ